MATLFQINSGITGSTGGIMLEIDKYAKMSGMDTYMASVNNRSSKKAYPHNHFTIGSIPEKHIHRLLAAFTGNDGCYSKHGTKALLEKMDALKPDIVQIHNLHWCYINIGMLFRYFKEHPNIQVVWTLHDCWPYTGHCPYYDMACCNKWKSGCHDCPSYRLYPASYFDNSKKMYQNKKRWFLNMPSLTLVTPSQWLNKEVQESFLNCYDTEIIHNGIDVEIFQRKKNNLRSLYNLESKFVILGTAYNWSHRKGFDVFLKLADMLTDEFAIVLVGHCSEEQIASCKEKNIVCLPRTSSKDELAELYSMADVFFNPTREEMFGLVNIEAQACGTPVITFNSGGSPECICPDCGYVIEKEDVCAAARCMKELRTQKVNRSALREWAERFNARDTYREYIHLYQRLMG